MSVLVFLSLLIWLYILSVVKRANLYYFEFIWGSVGFFILALILIQPLLLDTLRELVASATGAVGGMFGIFHASEGYPMLYVQTINKVTSIYLYIDYECAGIIEMMAYVSMLIFFEIYSRGERIVLSIFGCVMIFLFNVIRLLSICLLIYFFGNDIFFVAHSIVGRILFYAMTIILYYIVFTRAQVVKQRIGGFTYAKHSDEHSK